MNRKNFLQILGLGALAAAVPYRKPDPSFSSPEEWEKKLSQPVDQSAIKTLCTQDQPPEYGDIKALYMKDDQGNIHDLMRECFTFDKDGRPAFRISNPDQS